MAENINLAEFDFNTDKVVKSLAELKVQMNSVNQQIAQSKKSNKELYDEYLRQIAVIKKLEEANEQNSDEYDNAADAVERLVEEMKQNEIITVQATSQLKSLKTEYNATSGVLASMTNQQGEYTSVLNTSNDAINREITSIASARASNKELLAIRNQLNPAIAEEAQLITDLNAKLDSNNAFIKENASAYEQQKINIGNYSEAITDALGNLNVFSQQGLSNFISKSQEAGGAGNLVGQTLSQITTGIVGATRAAVAFIATPLGAALALLAGFGLAAKSIFDYNNSIKESIKLTEQFTGLSGAAADAVRVQAQAISDTFGNDFQENIKAAQKLVTAFGIDYNEALNQVERGLIRGGNANNQFFDSLSEYGVFFAKAGYSAQDFIDVVNAGFDLGVYNDKLPDAIKEAGISLEEQTTSTRDALVNAFGATFTDDILKRIKTGETTVKEALAEISSEAEKANLNSQQYAQLTADVFRGAGEDIGGASKLFEALRHANEEANKPLSETEKHFLALSEANKELQASMDEALKSDSVIAFQKAFELGWVRIQKVFFDVVSVVREFYERAIELSGRVETFTSIFGNLQKIGQAVGRVFETLQTTFGRITEALGLGSGEAKGFISIILSAIDPIKKLEIGLNLLTDAIVWIVEQFEESTIRAEAFGRSIVTVYRDIKNLDFNSLLDIKGTVDANAEAIKKENALYDAKQLMLESTNNLTKTLQGLTATQNETALKGLNEQKKATKDLDKEREEAYQRQLQRMNEELDLWIANQGIKARSLQEELDFERKVAQDSIKILDYELKNKKISQTKYNTEVKKIQNDLAQTTAELAIQNAGNELRLWVETNASKIDLAKFFSNEQLRIEDERLMQLEEKQKAFALSQFEQGVTNKTEYDEKIKELDTQFLAERQLLYDTYEINRKARELEQADLDFESKIIRLQEENATQFEIEQEIRNQQRATELANLQNEAIEKLYTHEMYKQAEANINAKYDDIDKKAKEANERTIYETQLQYAQMALNTLGEVIGKETAAGKALAAAQIGLSTAMAIMKSYEQLGPIGGSIFAAVVGTVAALQIRKVTQTKPPKVDTNLRGYAEGGIISGGVSITRSNGDNRLITAKDGEVILNEHHQRLAGGAPFFSALGVPGFATSGVVGGSSMLPSQSSFVQNQVTNQVNMDSIREAVREGAMEGSMQGSEVGSRQGSAEGANTGIRDLSTDRQILKDSAF